FGSRFFAASHTRSPATRCADCFQKRTSSRSRSYQPLPTTPCEDGASPVSIDACAGHVTAGSAGVIGATKPSVASAASRGACRRSPGVSPTTSRTRSGFTGPANVPAGTSVRQIDAVDPARDLRHQRDAVAGAAAAAERRAGDVEVQPGLARVLDVVVDEHGRG